MGLMPKRIRPFTPMPLVLGMISPLLFVNPGNPKALKNDCKDKAMAEMAALLVLRKKWEAFCSEDAEG